MSFAAGRAAARPCDLLPALLQSSPQHPSTDRPHQHLWPPCDQGARPLPLRIAAMPSLLAPSSRRPPTSTSVSVSASLIRLARICVARSSSVPSPATKTRGSRSWEGIRASLPPIWLVSSSVLLCCQILRSCRTSTSLPSCEEHHQVCQSLLFPSYRAKPSTQTLPNFDLITCVYMYYAC